MRQTEKRIENDSLSEQPLSHFWPYCINKIRYNLLIIRILNRREYRDRREGKNIEKLLTDISQVDSLFFLNLCDLGVFCGKNII